MVYRLFVEKKPGFDVEAGLLATDLRQNLGVKAVTGVRIFRRYDIAGLSSQELELIRSR